MKQFYSNRIRNKTKTLLLGLFLMLWSFQTKAQTTLAVGDILFTHINTTGVTGSNPDIFTFVTLTPIAANTVIYFSDRGYQGGTTWQAIGTTEGSISWTVGTAVALGQQVVIEGFTAKVSGVTNGTVAQVTGGNAITGLALGNTGDQMYAFQGGNGDPSAAGITVIAGMNWQLNCDTSDAGWNGSGCPYGVTSSKIPPGLSNTTSAIVLGVPNANPGYTVKAKYKGCSIGPKNTIADLRTALLDKTNWDIIATPNTYDATYLYDNCTIYSNCTTPSINTQPVSKTVCASANTTFAMAATNATSYKWQVNTGSGFTDISNGGVYSNATTATLTITGATTAMNGYTYQGVAMNGACLASTNIATLTVSNITVTSLSQTNASCNAGNNGAASVNTPTGGTAPYTYNWTPGNPTGDGTNSVTGLTAGTWTCTVTDANGCSGSLNFNITQPTAISFANAPTQTNVSCNGGTNGTASITAPTGGAGGYTYDWTPGNPTGDGTTSVSGLSAGTWTCTVTDANGCTAFQTVTITQPTVINTATNSQTNVSCNGGSNGSATVTPSGGAGGYTYSWLPSGGTAATATGLSPGSYTVTVTDANGCTATRNFTITQPTAISTATNSQTNVSCNGGTNGSATVTPTGGAGGYTYSWSPTGGTASTATGLSAGSYTVTIIDANSCQASRIFTITQPTAISATTSQTNVSCNGGTNGSATVTPTGGAGSYTYLWSPSGGTAATATGLSAGSYSVTIKDANNCSTTKNFTITQPTAISTATNSQTNVSCNGGTNGSASVTPTGGAGGYTYSWSPTGGTASTATGLSAGSYTVTIIDANSCQASRIFTITQPTAISATTSQTNVSCNGGTNGSATVTPTGGAGSYTYLWSPSGGTAATATGLSAGSYSVTIKDANNCSTTKNFTITQPTAISATTSQTNVSCNGGTNGSATVTPAGGTGSYTYSWSPSGGTAATATGLSAGNYSVTITDANNCSTTKNFTITQPTAISATTSQTNVSCNGDTNGSATVTPTGGTGSYTYSWSPTGGTAATATDLSAGSYSVTITDANNCSTTKNFTITQPTAISATTSQTNVSCNGGTNGSATVTPTGGTGSYTYLWSPSGGTAATATGLSAGSYNVIVKDANGCTALQTVTITQPTAISATTSQTNVSCNGGTNGSATVTPTGGAGGYTYSWSPIGGTAATATGLAAGNYNVTITDANNCSIVKNITITEPAAIDATTSLAGATITANQTGATYQWYECPSTIISGQTGQSYTPTVNGSYKVMITIGGCNATSSCVLVNTLANPNIEEQSKFVIYPNPNKGIVNIQADYDGDVYITNQLGQTIKTVKISSGIINTINLENYANGVYFITEKKGNKTITHKLILNK